MERLVSRGRQNPTLHKLKLNPGGIPEHVVGSCYSKKWSCYLDGWLALACESRHLLSCQATFRRFPPFRHDDHYAEETDQRYGTRRKCAVEERSHLTEDIRKPVLPFVHFCSVRHQIDYLFTWSLYSFVEVIHYCTQFHYLFLSL